MSGDQTWEDGDITCGADGWESKELDWIPEKVAKLAERRRRHKTANWFELIASYRDEDDEDDLLRIGKSNVFEAKKDGELYLFANDLRSKYGNNKGVIEVRVTRVE